MPKSTGTKDVLVLSGGARRWPRSWARRPSARPPWRRRSPSGCWGARDRPAATPSLVAGLVTSCCDRGGPERRTEGRSDIGSSMPVHFTYLAQGTNQPWSNHLYIKLLINKVPDISTSISHLALPGACTYVVLNPSLPSTSHISTGFK